QGSFAEEVRADLLDSCTHAVRVRRQIERPQRADLAVPDDTGVRFDFDNGRVENRHRFAARPLVTPFLKRQIGTVGANAFDFHRRVSSRFACGLALAPYLRIAKPRAVIWVLPKSRAAGRRSPAPIRAARRA